MSDVLVHIVLQRPLLSDRVERRRVYELIGEVADLRDVNQVRFERYGILTARVDERHLARIREVPGVASVSPDRQQVALR